jgi:serine/threonine-protein kinase
LALDPNNTISSNVNLELLIRSNRLAEALELAKRLVQNYPTERVFALQLGQVYSLQGDYKAAEIAYGLSLQINPDNTAGYLALAQVFSDQKRLDESMQALQLGIKKRPTAELYRALGNRLFSQGDYVGAASAYEAAVASNQGNQNDYTAWARLAETMAWLPGKADVAKSAYDNARRLLKTKLKEHPHNAKLLSLMGLYCAKLGENADALMYVQKSLDLAPNDAEIQFRAGVSFEMLDMRTQALVAITNAKEFNYPTKLIESEPELLELRRDPKYLR